MADSIIIANSVKPPPNNIIMSLTEVTIDHTDKNPNNGQAKSETIIHNHQIKVLCPTAYRVLSIFFGH